MILTVTGIYVGTVNSSLEFATMVYKLGDEAIEFGKFGNVFKTAGQAIGLLQAVQAGGEFFSNPSLGTFANTLMTGSIAVVKNPYAQVGYGLLQVTGLDAPIKEATNNAIRQTVESIKNSMTTIYLDFRRDMFLSPKF